PDARGLGAPGEGQCRRCGSTDSSDALQNRIQDNTWCGLYAESVTSVRREWSGKLQFVVDSEKLRVGPVPGHRQAEACRTLFNFDTAPERDPILDLSGCRFGIRIIPGSVFVHISIDDDVVVACLALPWTSSVGCALLKVLALD